MCQPYVTEPAPTLMSYHPRNVINFLVSWRDRGANPHDKSPPPGVATGSGLIRKCAIAPRRIARASARRNTEHAMPPLALIL